MSTACTGSAPMIGVGVGGKRRAPLRRVLAVAPSGAVGGDVGFGALLERDRLGRVEPLPRPLSAPRLDRVYSLMPLAARVQRLRAGFLKAIERERTKPHPPRPAIEHVAQHPISRAFGRDAQIEPAAVGIHAGFFRLLDFQRREPPDRPRHCLPSRFRIEPLVHNPVHNYRPNYGEGLRTSKKTVCAQLCRCISGFCGLWRMRAKDGE